MNALEGTQYKVALAVSGAWESTHLNKLYEELSWGTLTHRRLVRRLTQFYKIMNNLTPEYLRSPIPFLKPFYLDIDRQMSFTLQVVELSNTETVFILIVLFPGITSVLS